MSELDSRSTHRAHLKTIQRRLYSSIVFASSHSTPMLLRSSHEGSKFPGSWEKKTRNHRSVEQLVLPRQSLDNPWKEYRSPYHPWLHSRLLSLRSDRSRGQLQLEHLSRKLLNVRLQAPLSSRNGARSRCSIERCFMFYVRTRLSLHLQSSP